MGSKESIPSVSFYHNIFCHFVLTFIMVKRNSNRKVFFFRYKIDPDFV